MQHPYKPIFYSAMLKWMGVYRGSILQEYLWIPSGADGVFRVTSVFMLLELETAGKWFFQTQN